MASAFSKLTVEIGGKIAGLTKSLKAAQVQVSSFGKNVSRTFNDAASAGAKGFKNVIRSDSFQAAAVAAGGIGYALQRSVRVAMEFEKSMSSVQAKLKPTQQEFAQLSDLAKELGRSTKFTASETAGAFDFLAMAGYKTNQIIAATPGILNLATAANMDIAESADIVSNILGGMGLAVEDTAKLTDVLAKTAVSGNVDINMLGQAFKYVAPVAKQAGASMEEMGASMAILGDSGIQASEAGTQLRSVLLRMAAPPTEAAKAFDKLGVSTKDAEGNLRPFQKILADVNNRMDELNMGSAERLAIQNALFGKTAVAGGAILQEAAANGVLADRIAKVSDNQGAASDMAKTMGNNFAGSMTRLQSAMDGLMMSLGGPLLAPLASFAEGLAGVASVVGDVLGKFPVLSGVIGVVSAAFVGLVALAPFIASLISVFSVLGPAITGLGIGATIAGWAGAIGPAIAGIAAVVTGPIGLTVAAIVGIGLALKALWDLCPPFREAMTAVWEGIKSTVMRAWEALKGAFQGMITYFGGLAKIIQGVFTFDGELIKEGFGQALSGVKQIFTSWIGWLRGFLPKGMNKAFGKAARPIAQRVERIIERIKSAFEGLVGFFSGIGEMIAGVFTMDGSRIAEGFQTAMDGVGQYVQAWLGGIGDLFGGSVGSWFSGIGDAARSAFEGLSTTLANVWQAVLDAGLGQMITGVQQIMQGVVDVVQGVWNTIVGIFTGNSEQAVAGVEQAFGGIQGIFDGLGNYFSGLWSLISTSAQATWDGLVTAATTCFNSIVSFISGIPAQIATYWESIKTQGQATWESLVAAATTGFNNIVSFVSGIPAQLATHWETIKTQGIEAFQALVDWIKNVPQMLLGVGEAIINTIIDGIKSRAEALKATVQEAFNGVREMLPFSDAKTGPFSELTKNGKAIVTTIARGVEMNERVLQDQLGNVARKSMEEVRRETVESDIAQNLGTDLADSMGQAVPAAPITAAPMPRQEEQKKGGLFGGLFDNGFGGLLGGLVDQFVPGLRGFGGAFGNMLDGQFDVGRLLGQAANSFLPGAGGAIASQLIPTVAPMLQGLLPEQGGFTQPQAPGLQGAAVDPFSMGLGGGGAQTMSINSPITINVTEPGASAQEIAGQVQMVFADLVSDAESGVRAMLND